MKKILLISTLIFTLTSFSNKGTYMYHQDNTEVKKMNTKDLKYIKRNKKIKGCYLY